MWYDKEIRLEAMTSLQQMWRTFYYQKKIFTKMLISKAKVNVLCTIPNCVIRLPLLCVKLCFCMMTVTFYIFSPQL